MTEDSVVCCIQNAKLVLVFSQLTINGTVKVHGHKSGSGIAKQLAFPVLKLWNSTVYIS